MNGAVGLLARGLFRRDRLLRTATVAVIAFALATAIAGDIAALREQARQEALAVQRYGAISVNVTNVHSDERERILRIAAESGVTLVPRVHGLAIANGGWVQFVALSAAEWANREGTSRISSPPDGGGEYRVGLSDPGTGTVRWQRVPGTAVLGAAGDAIVFDLGWLHGMGVVPTHLAGGEAGDVFVQALELEETLAGQGIEVNALAWPEQVGVAAYVQSGSLPALLRTIGAGAGLLAIFGVLVVAGRDRTAHVALARSMGLSNTIVRAAFGRELTRGAIVAVGIVAGVCGVLVVVGAAETAEFTRASVLRAVVVALVLPGFVGRLVAWRTLGVPLPRLRSDAW